MVPLDRLRVGTLEIAALATLAVDPMARLIGSFRERRPGVHVRVLAPEGPRDVTSLVRAGACELGATHLPLPGVDLDQHLLGSQELMFVLPTGDAASRRRSPIRAEELAATPFVVGPIGTSTRALLEQALGAVGVAPQIAWRQQRERQSSRWCCPAQALRYSPLAAQARQRGAIVRPASPPIHRDVGLVHRPAPLSSAARAFLELAAR